MRHPLPGRTLHLGCGRFEHSSLLQAESEVRPLSDRGLVLCVSCPLILSEAGRGIELLKGDYRDWGNRALLVPQEFPKKVG